MPHLSPPPPCVCLPKCTSLHLLHSLALHPIPYPIPIVAVLIVIVVVVGVVVVVIVVVVGGVVRCRTGDG